MTNFVVALDGPAGSGKSSISKLVADRFGFTHIDTGAMYRAVTYEALKRKININNEDEYSFLNETKVIYLKDKAKGCFDLSKAECVLCNYESSETLQFRPYEARVYCLFYHK